MHLHIHVSGNEPLLQSCDLTNYDLLKMNVAFFDSLIEILALCAVVMMNSYSIKCASCIHGMKLKAFFLHIKLKL